MSLEALSNAATQCEPIPTENSSQKSVSFSEETNCVEVVKEEVEKKEENNSVEKVSKQNLQNAENVKNVDKLDSTVGIRRIVRNRLVTFRPSLTHPLIKSSLSTASHSTLNNKNNYHGSGDNIQRNHLNHHNPLSLFTPKSSSCAPRSSGLPRSPSIPKYVSTVSKPSSGSSGSANCDWSRLLSVERRQECVSALAGQFQTQCPEYRQLLSACAEITEQLLVRACADREEYDREACRIKRMLCKIADREREREREGEEL